MKNEKNEQIIKDLERVICNLEKVQAFNNLQEDFINFNVYDDGKSTEENALLTLNELKRTQNDHLLLSYTIDDYLRESINKVSNSLRKITKD